MKSARLLLIFAVLFTAAFALVLLVSAGRASGDMVHTPLPARVTLVVDATGGMTEEVSALRAAWDQVFAPGPAPAAPADHEICHPEWRCRPLTSTFTLIPFRDEWTVLGPTRSGEQVSTWLSNMPLGGDGTCPDNALGALWATAGLSPRNPFSGTESLLLTDSAPRGGRAALARTINRLARAGVAVNPVATGWCVRSPLAPGSMDYLAAGTGGLPATDLTRTTTITDVLRIPLGDMETPHVLASTAGGGGSDLQVYEETIIVDSSVERLDIVVAREDQPCNKPYFPQPCSRAAGPARPAMLTVAVRDPAGSLVTPALPGVFLQEAAGITYYQIDPEAYGGPTVGSFTVEIEGINAGYFMRASAATALGASLFSPHVLPAGRPSPIVVGLLLPAVQRAAPDAPQPTEELFGNYHFLTGEVVPLDLKDDGLSRDGQAGDHIFGGVWVPEPGLWQVRAFGRLDDGTLYQRAVGAPIRVLRFRLEPPTDNQSLPGGSTQLGFVLANDDDESKIFDVSVTSEMGWALTDTVPASITLGAGETAQVDVLVEIPSDAPAGAVEETTLTAVARDGTLLDSASVSALTTAVDQLTSFLPMTRRE